MAWLTLTVLDIVAIMTSPPTFASKSEWLAEMTEASTAIPEAGLSG
jgi:hypothetical protein